MVRGACGGDAFAGELSALGDGACRVRKAVPATFVAPSVATTQTAVFTVVNMTCAECTFSLAQALRQTPGVSDSQVDFTSKCTVRYAAKVDVPVIQKTIERAGYPATRVVSVAPSKGAPCCRWPTRNADRRACQIIAMRRKL